MKLVPVDYDPFSDEPKKVRKLTPVPGDPFKEIQNEDPGMLGAIGLGFGRTADKMLQGGKQAALTVASLVSDDAKAALAKQAEEQRFRDEGYAPLQEQRPIASAVGEAAPMLVMPMGGSLKAATAIGALPGLLEYGTAEEKLLKGAAGALGSGAGYGVGKALGAIASPGMKAVNPEADRLAGVMAREGVPLDAAQATGNQTLQSAKAALDRLPWTASGQQAKKQAQQEAFNRAMLRKVGADASSATPDVLGDAFAATGAKMDFAAPSTLALTIDDAAVAKIADVEKTFFRRLPTDQKATIRSYLDDMAQIVGERGALPGDVYNKTRSELGRLAANTDNITMREGAKGLQKALDDVFDRQAAPEAVKAMKEARQEYARLLTMEKAMQKGRSLGDLPSKQLYAQAQQDVPGFTRGGGGDFADLIRGGRQFLPDAVPNSGTPERMMFQNLLTAGSMSGLGALGGMAAGDPASGAAMGLAGFGLSKGAQGLLNSPQFTKYLQMKLLEEEEKRLLAQLGSKAGLLTAGALSNQ